LVTGSHPNAGFKSRSPRTLISASISYVSGTMSNGGSSLTRSAWRVERPL
jgi:hypothetical protein